MHLKIKAHSNLFKIDTFAGYAGMYCQNPHIWDLLFDYGMNPTETLREEWGNVTLAMACVLRGADVNMRADDGETKFFEEFIRLLAHEEQHGTLIEGLTLFGRRIVAGMIYAAGYNDGNGKVREILKRSESLRTILDGARHWIYSHLLRNLGK